MNRAFAYGLILLAASTAATQSARACSSDAGSAVGDAAQFLLNGSGAANLGVAQGYFGIDVRDVTADQLGTLRLKEARGAEVILVDHDAPAGKVGLREHDVILQMNGQAVDGRDQIRRMLRDSPPGKTITLVISREGQMMTVTTQMSTHEEVDREALENRLTVPEPQAPPSESAESTSSPGTTASSASVRGGNSFMGPMVMNPAYTGLYLQKMTAQLAGFFGVPNGAGLLVCSVVPNSPAAAVGFHAGDVVIRVNAHPILTTNDWDKTIKNSHGQPLSIVVLRDKREQTLTLTPEGRKHSSLESPVDDSTHVDLARLGLSWMPRS